MIPFTYPSASKNIIVYLWYSGMGQDKVIGKVPEDLD